MGKEIELDANLRAEIEKVLPEISGERPNEVATILDTYRTVALRAAALAVEHERDGGQERSALLSPRWTPSDP